MPPTDVSGATNFKEAYQLFTLLTGASPGICHATAKLFDAEGAKVIAGARRESELEELVAQIRAAGGKADRMAGDMRSEDFSKALVALAVQHYARLDVTFHNAGLLVELPIAKYGSSHVCAYDRNGTET